jgi:hypothetical protein
MKFGPNHNNIILKKLGHPPKFHPTIKLRNVVLDLEYFHQWATLVYENISCFFTRKPPTPS